MGLEDSVDVSDAVARVKLEKLGYKQEMTRSRGLVHILFIQAKTPTELSVHRFDQQSWQFYRWILVSISTQTLALSLAEICSKYPTSAGTYYWCYRLASPRTRVLASWINGWLTVVGIWTVTLSTTFGVAEFVVAGAGIYLPEWTATRWQTCKASSKAPTGHRYYLCLLDWLRHYRPTELWIPGWWSFVIGLWPDSELINVLVYTYAVIGMITNMAEEVHNPSEILPKAIAWSIPIGTLSGGIFLLPIIFTFPLNYNLAYDYMETEIDVTSIFTSVMGSRAVFGIGIFCAISTSCAASRATWAFARDKGIPFHQTFSKISPCLGGVPVNALLLSTVIQIILGSIYLGTTAAFSAALDAFMGVAGMCLGASYAMPVAISLMNDRNDMRDAPFNLGGFGYVINTVAVFWIVFAMVLFSVPALIPVTSVSMIGRFYYTGPSILDH
ncbi:hypothetical protein BDR07DRAFT_1378391 [Suillus spraguei]|nr:hypothetical protein BDR07DRAFT_1378391 [Suillus spraguei]